MTRAATTNDWAGNAGSAVLRFCGHWMGRGLILALKHPLNSATALILTTGIAFGATNAMFLQTVRHPAPLFMETASIAHPLEKAPVPVSRPPAGATQPALVVPTLAAPADAGTTIVPQMAEKIGNEDVAALQTRLAELGFFVGKVDGYYGPKTADAIRRFETVAGLVQVGAVSLSVLEAARAFSPVSVSTPMPQTHASVEPVTPAIEVAAPEAQPLAPEEDPIGRLVANVALATPAESAPVVETKKHLAPAVDPELVRMVQTGLGRLGFLHAEVSGTLNAETARAIREFENYNNYQVTGELTADLVDVLMANGAFN